MPIAGTNPGIATVPCWGLETLRAQARWTRPTDPTAGAPGGGYAEDMHRPGHGFAGWVPATAGRDPGGCRGQAGVPYQPRRRMLPRNRGLAASSTLKRVILEMAGACSPRLAPRPRGTPSRVAACWGATASVQADRPGACSPGGRSEHPIHFPTTTRRQPSHPVHQQRPGRARPVRGPPRRQWRGKIPRQHPRLCRPRPGDAPGAGTRPDRARLHVGRGGHRLEPPPVAQDGPRHRRHSGRALHRAAREVEALGGHLAEMGIRVVLKPFNIDRLEGAIADGLAQQVGQGAEEPARGR